ncbi:S8 family serine peptidase [Sphingobium sp. H39-3-25]|nr:S8 family serine peptidase [Sphingobium arseniciresistens]
MLESRVTEGSVDPSVRLWFLGAEQANEGNGITSAIIRTYTRVQGLLNYLDPTLQGNWITQQEMDLASDSVGAAVISSILDRNQFYTELDPIADHDAHAIAQVLNLDPNDAQWSGDVLFPLMGLDELERFGPRFLDMSAKDKLKAVVSLTATFAYLAEDVMFSNVFDLLNDEVLNPVKYATVQDLKDDVTIFRELFTTWAGEIMERVAPQWAPINPLAREGRWTPATSPWYATEVGTASTTLAGVQAHSNGNIGIQTRTNTGQIIEREYHQDVDGTRQLVNVSSPYGQNFGSLNGTAANINAATQFLNQAYNIIRNPGSTISVTVLGFENENINPLQQSIFGNGYGLKFDPAQTTAFNSAGIVEDVNAGTLGLVRVEKGPTSPADLAAGRVRIMVYSQATNELISNTVEPIAPAQVPLGQGGLFLDSAYTTATSTIPNPLGAATGSVVDDRINIINTPQSGAPGSEPIVNEGATPWLNGLLYGSGTYRVTMNPGVLNGDGLVNVGPSLIAGDAWRPGGQQLAPDTNLYIGNENILTRGLLPSSTNSAVNLLSGFNHNYLNIDPFVVDLDGDGVELRPFDAINVLFNVDSDAYKERTGWLKGDDGFLVRDINGNGRIDSITEIMSDYYNGRTPNGAAAVDVLRTLDSNADGKFTSADTQFASFRIWQDANENGETDAGELKTFASLGISGFDLTKTSTIGLIQGGADVLARHDVILSNGTRREALSVEFVTDPFGTIIEALGSDFKASFQSFEGSADVKALIAGSSALNVSLLASNPEGFRHVYGGDGADTITGDANDNWIIGGKGADRLRGAGGNDFLLFDADDLVVFGGPGFDIAQAVGTNGVVLNLTQSAIETAIGSSASDILIGGGNSNVFIAGGKGADFIYGGGADDVLSGEDGDDLIEGMAGDDLIRGHRGQDLLRGGQGDDMIYGGDDQDVLIGSDGNDLLSGGAGDDALSGGDGIDTADFSGDMQDYSFVKSGTEWIITDRRVGSPDGTDRLDSIERLNFRNLKDVDLAMPNPLPANDLINVAAAGPYTIAASALLANDVDLQGGVLSITSVLNPVGGTVALSGTNIIFTPTAGSGIMSFQYKIKDAQNNAGALIGVIGNPGAGTAEAKGTVFLRTPTMPLDPLLRDQWYVSEIDLLKVWKEYSGTGIDIAVSEPGNFDVAHIDLDGNFGAAWREDGSGGAREASTHATLVAGVIGAEKNGVGGVGVAHGATLHSVSLPQSGTGDFRNILLWRNYDVVNNSWGFSNRFGSNFLVDTAFGQAFRDTAALGRGGLGTVNVFAAGNSRADGGNANDGNVTNSRYSIAVGAINHQGDLGALVIGSAPFSSPGAAILVSAPGSNISSTGRLVENPNGSAFGSDFETAQGTSFATPIVSGVVALMLEANPTLGYRDVQDILALSAKRVDVANTGWAYNGAKNWNGGAMHISHDYGFGEVDARAAVRLAESWATTHVVTDSNPSTFDLQTRTASSGTLNAALVDNGVLTRTLTIPASGTFAVEHAEVRLTLDHQQIGDLVVTLISPTGTRSVLIDRPGKTPGSTDAADRGDGATNLDYTLMTTLSRGEAAAGNWTLEVRDAVTGQTGTLKSWTVTLTGKANEADEVFVYTDEFATLGTGTRATLTASGGYDAINASAVSTNSVINLNPGTTSTIAGKALLLAATSTSVVDAFGGDGNDTITGSAADNLIFGGRGNDILSGGNGNDILAGGAGADQLNGGAGTDTAHYYATGTAGVNVNLALATAQSGGEAQGDVLTGIENVNGTRFNDVLTGNTLANILEGFDGDDTLAGGLGADILVGDDGTDTVTYAASNASISIDLTTLVNTGGHAEGDQLYGIESIIGSAYDDNFRGTTTAMAWTGGNGSDLLVVGAGAERFDGGVDTSFGDIVDLGWSNAKVTLNLATGAASGGYAAGDTYLNIEHVFGSNYGDNLTGSSARNIFILFGGVDTVDGAGGIDAVSYEYSSAGVKASLASSVGSTGDATGDVFVNVEDLTGTLYADTLTGNSLANTIDGYEGNDIIDGGAGNDTLIGGAGNDVLTGNAGSDTIFGGTGTDTAVYLQARSMFTLTTGTDANGAYTDVFLTGSAMTDRVYQVEYLQFTDQTIAAPAGAMTMALRSATMQSEVTGTGSSSSRPSRFADLEPAAVRNRSEEASGTKPETASENSTPAIHPGQFGSAGLKNVTDVPALTEPQRPRPISTGGRMATDPIAAGQVETGADVPATEADRAAQLLADQEVETLWSDALPTLGHDGASGWWRASDHRRPGVAHAAGITIGATDEEQALDRRMEAPTIAERQRFHQAMAAFRGDAGAAPAVWRRQASEGSETNVSAPTWQARALDRHRNLAA